MMRALLPMTMIAALAAGCYTEDSVGVGYSAGYAVAPGMVEVSPGVQVIADYDVPVFYSDGAYWRYDGGIWYRSGYYDRGWGVAYNVPVGIRQIDRPYAYAHYRGSWGGNRGYDYRQPAYSGGTVVRDHRSYGAPVYRPSYRAAPAYRSAPMGRGPVVRDHRR